MRTVWRPGTFSSLKSLSCAHGGADCDCATDRLWKITSDVFMGFWRDSPIPQEYLLPALQMLHNRQALSEVDLIHIVIWKPGTILGNRRESKRICSSWSDLFLLAASAFERRFCSSPCRLIGSIWRFGNVVFVSHGLMVTTFESNEKSKRR